MIAFAAAVFLLIATPGPGVLSCAGVGAAFGFRAGLRYVAGLNLGNNLVIAAVITGLAAVILAAPVVRGVLLAVSACYLAWLALRIAAAGKRLAFGEADRAPGLRDGILLQAVNPKAYVVSTTLFTGFPYAPDSLLFETVTKILIFNAIWLPLHLGWLWAGGVLHRLDLPERAHRRINLAMAAAMIAVVALALFSMGGSTSAEPGGTP
ncbi:LysE family translocator [Mangrovicoccus sp. HB161399]|uniref:LysE family translocator n=1 Tax=Mangrovicoccus sp. HB161399 TaxID=2720392 RepID=UPI001551E499|nr:LysE family translocator [Mangrovicoccus sp. HB161399]